MDSNYPELLKSALTELVFGTEFLKNTLVIAPTAADGVTVQWVLRSYTRHYARRRSFGRHFRKLLILKEGNLRKLVGARGFELLPQTFIQYRARSPGPRKQRPALHFPPFQNPSERQQTPLNADRLLHTHYTRKAFLWHKSGRKIRPSFSTAMLPACLP